MHWKDQPLAIAAISAVATSVFFFAVVLPTWLRSKDNQIEDQQKAITFHLQELRKCQSESRQLNDKVNGVRAQARAAEDANIRLRRNFDSASGTKLFLLDDPYPRGFQAVKIADTIDIISRVYEGVGKITDYGAMVLVEFKRPTVFHTVVYYCNQYGTPRTVTHVFFQFDASPEKTQFFKDQLIDAYGKVRMSEITTEFNDKQTRWLLDEYALDLSEGGITLLKMKK